MYESSKGQGDLGEMRKRRATLEDGRYLFNLSFPYMMVLHQRPTNGDNYDFYHFHVEFYPPLRTATRLKYLAGSEIGAGMFINDTLAEEKAAELRARVPSVEWGSAKGGT